jgi:hypothetical protein
MKDSDENASKRRKLFLGTVLNEDRESHAVGASSPSDEEPLKAPQATKNGHSGGWKRKLDA